MSEDKYRAALDAAAKQLSCRALSTKMLRGKLLAKGHDEEAADYALAWLTERSLLSDGQFAESVVRSYARRGYGAARIRQELSRRGISREDADAAMELFSPALPQMLSLLEKRLHGDLSDRKSTRRSPPCSGAAFRGATSKTLSRNTAHLSTSTNNLHPLRAHFCAEGVIFCAEIQDLL